LLTVLAALLGLLGQSPIALAKDSAESADADAKSDEMAASDGESDDDDQPAEAKKVGSDDADKEDKKEPDKKDGNTIAKKDSACPAPSTYSVKHVPFKITVELDGVFEAKTAREILIKPEEWTTLVVDSAVAHGARVRKGDVLVRLDHEKIDRTIADLRAEAKLSAISIAQNEDQLRGLEKTGPLDLQASLRAARVAEEDRRQFIEVGRPFAIRMNDFSLKIAKESLEYEEEELGQLEKMYKADDITEETEQIVLQRARDSVDKAKFMLDYMKLNHHETATFGIPRMEELVKESAERRSLEAERKKIELPLSVQKLRLDLDKLRMQRERTEERLKTLLADRALLTAKSPIDGIVYYGKAVRGKFSDSTSLADALRHQGAIVPNQIIMTVVAPRPMFVQSAVAEEHLHRLRPGLKGIVTPTGYPDLKLPAEVADVADVPTAPGSFDARFSLQFPRKARFLMPGMTCKVKLIPYLGKDAIAVPLKAVFCDELDDQERYVWVLDNDEKPRKQPVEVGEKNDKLMEIRKGLAEGQKILLEAPKEED
jgi:multidrug efflux pump subunit AcrA (membrane-fusion protein)